MTLAEPLPAVNLVAAGIPALVDEVVGSPRPGSGHLRLPQAGRVHPQRCHYPHARAGADEL